VFRGELDAALRLDEKLLRLSRNRNDSVGLVLGHFSFGRDLMFAGSFASSRSYLEEVLIRENRVGKTVYLRTRGARCADRV
jgi:hypothetical protein